MADEKKVEEPFAERKNGRDNIDTNKEKVSERYKEVAFSEEIEVHKVIQADDADNETILNQSNFPNNESGKGVDDNLKQCDTEDAIGQMFGNGDKCTKDDQVDGLRKVDDGNLGIKDDQDVQHVRNGDQGAVDDQIDVKDASKDNIGLKHDNINGKTVGNSGDGTKYNQLDVQSTGKDGQLTKDDQEENICIDNQGTIAYQVNGKKAGNGYQSTKGVEAYRHNAGNCDQVAELVLRKTSQEEQDDLNYTGIKKTNLNRNKEQTMNVTEKKEVLGLGTECIFINSIKIVNGIEQPSDNTILSEEHIEENIKREVITPRQRILNATDDNDSGHGHADGMVDLESDEHAEFVHDGDDDGDIEELQKLIEEHHLTKCDSKAELSNTGNRMLLIQEDQSEKPYYDKVPPISASKRPGQRLAPNRALIAQIPTSSVKWNLSDGRISTQQSGRLPPNVIKMSTVMLSAKKRRTAVVRSVSQYYEDKKHAKLLRWDECVNSRPPLPIDLDLPGPWHYSPTNKPPNETNAPEYSFGMKFYERGGGARTAHAKTWFNSTSNYTTKVNFEKRWPSPAQYSSKPLLGRRHYTLPDFPVYTIGVRSNFVINKKGSEYEPSPNEYYPHRSIALTLPSAPAYTFGSRHTGTCTSIRNTDPNNPGPGNYTPQIKFMSTKRHRPSFTIKGVRVPKSHMLGPHATL
ncbi:uncharacterized protein LOC117121068 [Anneissia japonica]|uniref:uncharacterized protein LOC117121068 n=1 Tax=Anneissia japonica TaxID=1529436 RepID=UPI0014256D08|nr:uncharacterized protein LOC117121068 [Anneissia japonica]XP_033122056.1 uncharacterized protein LOC117121068 [Anneissia japonica]